MTKISQKSAEKARNRNSDLRVAKALGTSLQRHMGPQTKMSTTSDTIVLTSMQFDCPIIFDKITFHVLQISYAIPVNNITARLSLLVTLSLCIINTLNSVARNAPR